VDDDLEWHYNVGMWKRALSFWVVLQLLLGVALVAVPVVLTGTISLAVTVPVYGALVALTVVRETFRSKRQQRANLVRRLNVLVSDFSVLTQGAHSSSVWAVLRDLRSNAQFGAQVDMSGNHQAGELLDERCQRLFSDAGNLAMQVHHMNSGAADDELRETVTDFGNLVVEYRGVVREFRRFLEDTKGQKEPIQYKPPFSTRVHRDLADEYDRLMDAVRQIREELRLYAGDDWLADEHLTRFPRASLLG
jgi:hypothetical protein